MSIPVVPGTIHSWIVASAAFTFADKLVIFGLEPTLRMKTASNVHQSVYVDCGWASSAVWAERAKCAVPDSSANFGDSVSPIPSLTRVASSAFLAELFSTPSICNKYFNYLFTVTFNPYAIGRMYILEIVTVLVFHVCRARKLGLHVKLEFSLLSLRCWFADL
jgi:hypothetical protein